MSRVPTLIAVLAVLCLPAAAGDASYGAKLTLEEATPIEKILDKPHAFEGKLVQVSGPISEVCANMGCWLRLEAPDGRTLLARSSGDKVTIPTDSAGRKATVEGVVVVDHDEAKPHEAEEGHTCPTAAIRLETKGVALH